MSSTLTLYSSSKAKRNSACEHHKEKLAVYRDKSASGIPTALYYSVRSVTPSSSDDVCSTTPLGKPAFTSNAKAQDTDHRPRDF